MKNFLIVLTIACCIFTGCRKEERVEAPKNNYAGTKWTAVDDIAEFIYGKTCTTTIEFFEDFTCQEIDKRIGMNFGSGTFVTQGSYKIVKDSVYWKIKDITYGGVAKGSVMTTNMRTMSMGYRTYTKDN